MKFVRVDGWEQGTIALSKRLNKELNKNQPVLWLVTGGSNIAASVAIMNQLPDETTKNLVVMLTDERYGEVGHLHSNAKQLQDAGFLPRQGIFIPTLTPGYSLEETRVSYEKAAEQAFKHAEVVIGQFGIGADGHIAGILPQSPAVSADGWVAAYETQQHTRITLTFKALRHVNVAYALAFGDDKKAALSQLYSQKLPLEEQPSQILKSLPEAYVYNDQIGNY